MTKLPTNPSVLRSYLAQDLPAASNYSGSLSFDGNRLYSYDSLLAIWDKDTFTLLIDSAIRNFSNTTQKQVHKLINLTNDSFTIFSLPLETDYETILNYYWNSIKFLIRKYPTAKVNKEIHKNKIKQYLDEVQKVVEYFNIDKSTDTYKELHKITKELFKQQIL